MVIYDYKITIRLKNDTNISKGDFKEDLRTYLKRPLEYKPDIYIEKRDINLYLDLLEDYEDIDEYNFINDVDTIHNLLKQATNLYKHIDTIDFYLTITNTDRSTYKNELLKHVNNNDAPTLLNNVDTKEDYKKINQELNKIYKDYSILSIKIKEIKDILTRLASNEINEDTKDFIFSYHIDKLTKAENLINNLMLEH
jgi:hypothetical protein